jgi:hypothetical protein
VRVRLLVLCLLALTIAGAGAQQRQPGDVSQLPVRRVILYKSGVGYFEHLGSVTGNADVAIQFTTGQLNDVLQSLTTLDLDGGSIANISYNSIAPIDQRLSALRLPLAADADRVQFYNALRGARVEVHTGTAILAGRILTVEQRTKTSATGSVMESMTDLTLASDDGAVRTIELTPATSVHFLDRDVREDVTSYLGIVASSRGEDVRRMVLSASGSGSRRLFVSYISEVPIWKSTYRLVLRDDNRRPILQGWAIVDNTIGQDWTGVDLSLVAGAPQSFVQQISQPYYARRPVVPLPPAVLLQPQTHAATLTAGAAVIGRARDAAGVPVPGVTVQLVDGAGRAVAEDITGANGSFSLTASPGAYTLRGELQGFVTFSRGISVTSVPQHVDVPLEVGAVAEMVAVSAAPARDAGRAGRGGGAGGGLGGGFPAAPPPSIADRLEAAAPAATAQELGDLFEYKLTQPVTIRKNESALVPILNAEVDAERISLWNRGAGSGRPLRGVWLTNTSALTLDSGSFTVIDANAFAGEGLVESMKPGEKRLVSYGSDLAVLVKAAQGNGSGHVTKLVAKDGILVASQEDRAVWNYTARNEDASPRTLVVEHPLRPGWTVSTDPAPAETSAVSARYRLALPSKQEASLTVTERHAGDVIYRLVDFDDRTIVVLVRGGVNEATLRRALQPLTDKRGELAEADARLATLNAEIAEMTRDQERVRENMKALRGTAEEKALTQRYAKELNDQEDRLASLRDEQKKATADRDARRRELNELVAKLTFEI